MEAVEALLARVAVSETSSRRSKMMYLPWPRRRRWQQGPWSFSKARNRRCAASSTASSRGASGPGRGAASLSFPAPSGAAAFSRGRGRPYLCINQNFTAPSRHRHPCSMAWRGRFLAARGPRPRREPTRWLICAHTQVQYHRSRRPSGPRARRAPRRATFDVAARRRLWGLRDSVEHAEARVDVGVRGVVYQRIVVVLVARVRRYRRVVGVARCSLLAAAALWAVAVSAFVPFREASIDGSQVSSEP